MHPRNSAVDATLRAAAHLAALVPFAVLVPCAALVCLGTAAPFALGAEWAIESGVTSKLEHNDNWRLQSTNKQAVTVLSVAPNAKFSTATEITAVSIELGANGYKSFGDDRLTRLDGLLGFGARTRSERAFYSLDGRIVRDSTLATELTETGQVLDRVQRNFYSLQGGYKYAMTQRLFATANGGAQIARYDNTISNGLRDFNQFSLGGGLEYLVTERTIANSQIGWTGFATVPDENRAKIWSWNNSLQHSFTENLKGTASVGVSRVNTEIQQLAQCLNSQGQPVALADCSGTGPQLAVLRPNIDATTINKLFSAQLDWQFAQLSSLNVGARQEVVPSAVGTVVRALSLFTGVSHSFTEKLRGGADFRYVDSKFAAGPGLGAEIETLLLGGQLVWQFTREWSIEGGARRTQVRNRAGTNSADANIVYGQVRYEWPRLSVAR